MVLGSDWNVIKRVFVEEDGEFWSAALPTPTVKTGSGRGGLSFDETRAAFARGGFSVVINRLQRRWRGVSEIALALEEVLGQPVNANMYMTPPKSQGFESHFDWMDGIIVQLEGSKTWILYDEMVSAPRADLKYKPAAADLGEPIAVLEIYPGDLLYIPRGWPHEAAVNATATRDAKAPSLHVTLGIETALAGSYESLFHHVLEVAAMEHPRIFYPTPDKDKGEATAGSDATRGNAVPWLQILHVWIHDLASRDERLRKAVPLAPLFSTSREGSGTDRSGSCAVDASRREASPVVLREFVRLLEACATGTGRGGTGDADASSTLKLLKSLLRQGKLGRVQNMFRVGYGDDAADDHDQVDGGGSSARVSEGELWCKDGGLGRGDDVDRLTSCFREEKEWDREALLAFDRGEMASFFWAKVEEFQGVASPEGGLKRMVFAATTRARERAARTERDLQRCDQGPS